MKDLRLSDHPRTDCTDTLRLTRARRWSLTAGRGAARHGRHRRLDRQRQTADGRRQTADGNGNGNGNGTLRRERL